MERGRNMEQGREGREGMREGGREGERERGSMRRGRRRRGKGKEEEREEEGGGEGRGRREAQGKGRRKKEKQTFIPFFSPNISGSIAFTMGGRYYDSGSYGKMLYGAFTTPM